MSDLISRQQAINALERAKQNIHHNIERAIGDAICEILDEVENGIKQLPPIHPVNNSEMPNGSDVISRQAAIDATKKHYRAHDNDLLELIAFDIEQLPPIQPKRGRWHYSDGKPARIGLSFGVICDQCGTESEYCTNFCGECGADMRGEQNG